MSVTRPVTDYLVMARDMPVRVDGNLSLARGFLPMRMHVTPLTGAHQAWEQAAAQLPDLVFTPRAQAVLEEIPAVSATADDLPDEQLTWAATLLGLMAHAYWRFGLDNFFQPRNKDVRGDLPEGILQPWAEVCRRLGRPHTGCTLEDLCFNNTILIDRSLLEPDGSYQLDDIRTEWLELLVPAYGHITERVFLTVFHEVHAALVPGMRLLPELETLLVEGGPEASDRVIEVLDTVAKGIRGATRAFRKISPDPASSTHCNPVDWAKSVGPFTVPAPGWPVGPSGSAAPIVHFLDALLSREDYSSELGTFSAMLRGTQLPRKQQVFLDLVRGMDLRGWILGLAERAPDRFARTRDAFNHLIDTYAGPDGFLGTHKAKVVDFFAVGTMVGRNQSTAHHQTYITDRSWVAMADRLHITMEERTVRTIG